MGAALCRPEKIDYDTPANLYHFNLLRSIGKGAFGKVQIVQHKQTKQVYALKYINKNKCCKQRAVANMIQERRLLEEIDCLFVVNMRFAFQDDEHCFLVLDLMLGGDLRFHLERLGSLPEEAVRIYVAEIATGLAYLHDHKIIHRDLKPDNILLDSEGHAHLTDFNIAVHVSERKMLTGVAGSMAYMAPEILTRKGYNYTVDWWSLGVCAFELIFGRRPFRGKSTSDLTHAITHSHAKFPEDATLRCTMDGVKAIKSMLERNPSKRLGCSSSAGSMQSFLDFQEHPWFDNVNWQKLQRKEAEPGFRPDANKDNYNPTHELERLLLDEDSPRARKRNPKRDIATLSPEMRMLETEFTPYDFRLMQRRSYYPNNPHTVTTVTATSSSGVIPSRPSTPPPGEHDHNPRIQGNDTPGPGGTSFNGNGQETPGPAEFDDTASFDETMDIRPKIGARKDSGRAQERDREREREIIQTDANGRF